MSARSADAQALSPALREAMAGAHMVPLWESPTAHKKEVQREGAHNWPWRVTRPIMVDVAGVRSPQVVERRVLSLVNPRSNSAEDEATTGTISATLQMLLPGETARVHRHSMNALRFVLEGSGASTVVDGKRCLMEKGDLILTPAWCWHEHQHPGGEPTIWLDVLDVALHLLLGTDAFEPGPAHDLPEMEPDDAYAVANLVPLSACVDASHSPVFRYPWAQASAAVQAAPHGADGARRVRYANPLTGGASMSLLDSCLMQVDAGTTTRAHQSTASMVCCVVEGEGVSEIGGQRIEWRANDVFTVPSHAWATHHARAQAARIFTVSNREVYRRLGLWSETIETDPAR